MADHFTTRLALPYPDIDDPADVPADMQQLAERLDVLIPGSGAAGSVLNRVTVGDVGMAGQIRAGHQLHYFYDFQTWGMTPVELWNLSNLNGSTNGYHLTNKGGVQFVPGINGLAATAAQFTGSTAQALYIADTGSADPFRIRVGSWGCWFRTARRGTSQAILSKANGYFLRIDPENVLRAAVYPNGIAETPINGVTDVADDRWHFAVAAHDGTTLRLYIDGVLEGNGPAGPMVASSGAINVGALGADAGNAALQPHFGCVDEAFVTGDVLNDDQVRALYCVRLPHGYGVVPSGVKLSVTRRRRGGAWAVADFPVQPLRLHNFEGGSMGDEGSNGVALTGGDQGNIKGSDGAGNARNYNGTGSNFATDAGLPAGLTARSFGCWFKSTAAVGQAMIAWGLTNAESLYMTEIVAAANVGDILTGPYVADGRWHLAVVVENDTAIDSVKRKLYLDGRLVSSSMVLNPLTLAGAGRFRIGANTDGSAPFTGQIDGVFVLGMALSNTQVLSLWAKGTQALTSSPKNAGDHVEGWDATSVLATFDTLDTSAQVDLGVAA